MNHVRKSWFLLWFLSDLFLSHYDSSVLAAMNVCNVPGEPGNASIPSVSFVSLSYMGREV